MNHNHEHKHNHEHDHAHEEGSMHGHTHHLPDKCDGEGHQHHHHEDGSCCCHHHEMQHHHGVNKLMIARLIVSALLFFSHEPLHDFLHEHHALEFILFAAVALIAGYDVIISAVKNLFKGKFFDEYFLMTFAAVAAFIIGNYHEGAAVMFLYRAGETFQDCAIRFSRRKIASVTGSYAPVGQEKGKTERFITRFAKVYTPVVLICALLIAVALPVFSDTGVKDAVYRALTFLVVACPCAVVISVPMAYFAGIAAGAGRGIFFHGPSVLDRVAKGELDLHSGEHRDREGGIVILDKAEQRSFAADLVIIGEDSRFEMAKTIATKARNIAFENIYATVFIKIAVIVLSAFGISSLWFAVFADSGIAICLTLNSLRAFRAKGSF